MNHLMKIKNKILDNLPTLFITLVFIFSMTLTFNHANSIPNEDVKPQLPPEAEVPDPSYKYEGLIEQSIPVYCGLSEFVLDTAEKMMREKQVAIGQIRKGGQPFGELIGILSFGHNLERNSGTFMMTMPGMGPNGENVSCILGYGLDWQFFNYDGSRIPLTDSL